MCIDPMGKNMMSPLLEKCYRLQVPLLPWIGYNDYKLYAQWTDNNIYFVTRLKDNADFIVIAEQKIPKNRNILADQLIVFS